MKIDVLIPTRERPELMLRNAKSVLETASNPANVSIHVGIDHDDPKIEKYIKICAEHDLHLMIHGGSGSVPACVNWMCKNTTGDIVVLSTDDMLFETRGWDDMLVKIFSDHPYVMVSPNLGRGRKKLEAPICTRKWIETAGSMLGEGFEHFCADEWTEKVATQAGMLEYHMEIVLQHLHPKYGHGAWDDVYLRKRVGKGQANDTARLASMAGQIAEAADRLRTAAQQEQTCV